MLDYNASLDFLSPSLDLHAQSVWLRSTTAKEDARSATLTGT